MKDELGRRMKRDYEDALRLFVPRHSHYIIRIDGRGFHKFTADLDRPWSRELADALDSAAVCLCRDMIGCRFAYGQSDEYSFLLSDIEADDSPLWFDGNVQKMVSVSASLFTAAFAAAFKSKKLAAFDGRLLVMARQSAVEDYFLWRQLDASANSLNMLVSAHFSHGELAGRDTAAKHDLLHSKGLNWAKHSADFKRGRVVKPASVEGGWAVDREIPLFNREPGYLRALITPARTVADSDVPSESPSRNPD